MYISPITQWKCAGYTYKLVQTYLLRVTSIFPGTESLVGFYVTLICQLYKLCLTGITSPVPHCHSRYLWIGDTYIYRWSLLNSSDIFNTLPEYCPIVTSVIFDLWTVMNYILQCSFICIVGVSPYMYLDWWFVPITKQFPYLPHKPTSSLHSQD